MHLCSTQKIDEISKEHSGSKAYEVCVRGIREKAWLKCLANSCVGLPRPRPSQINKSR